MSGTRNTDRGKNFFSPIKSHWQTLPVHILTSGPAHLETGVYCIEQALGTHLERLWNAEYGPRENNFFAPIESID